MKKRINYIKQFLLLILILFFYSCVPVKQLSYFNDLNEIVEPAVNPRVQKTILPFDRLYIKVLSTDLLTSQIFNGPDEMRSSSGTSSIISYPVDEAGDINFPFAGNIKVSAMTTADAAKKIQNALNEYVSKTSVTVKFVDNQVSVIGEVNQQGVHSFPQDKLNIYEALALGGGLTRFGNRRNIILIRQEGDKIMHYKLNLSDSKISGKDYYYVLPNDVIVVEPLKSISSSYQNNSYTTILTSITTLIAVLLFTGF
jgi:polysaccharide export outer membrane protein